MAKSSKPNRKSFVGSGAANFHQANRSEYLAHYVFSSFGTSVPVPSKEDTGIDLYCTLTDRIGKRIWPREHFTVQVKSLAEPWIFRSRRSVKWFVQHPFPIFLCVVKKSEARLRVYHTLPRFAVWAIPSLPEYLELKPGDPGTGEISGWDSGTRFSLGPPILDFTIHEALQEGKCEEYAEVLASWTKIERENLFRISANVRAFQYPSNYMTNIAIHHLEEIPAEFNEWRPIAKKELKETADRLKILLVWLVYQMHHRGDTTGAIRGALLFRHLFGEEVPEPMLELHSKLTQRLGEGRHSQAGLEEIEKALDKFLPLLAGDIPGGDNR